MEDLENAVTDIKEQLDATTAKIVDPVKNKASQGRVLELDKDLSHKMEAGRKRYSKPCVVLKHINK